MLVQLRITKPLPGGGEAMTIPIDPLVTSCKFSTSLPGGFNSLQVGIPEDHAPELYRMSRPADIGPLYHVEATIGGARLHEGRVMQRHRPDGDVLGFQSTGYGLTATADDYYPSSSATKASSGTILREVLTLSPLLHISTKPNDWQDPGILHARSDFAGKAPFEVINQLSTEGGGGQGSGGSNAVNWQWAVWEGRAASWKPLTVPTTPDYVMSLKGITIDENYANMYGTVTVTYGTGGATNQRTPEKTDPNWLNTYGFRRAINIQGSNLNASAAGQFRDTELGKRKQSEYALRLTFKAGMDIKTASGQMKPTYLVRAGEWIQAGDLPMLPILLTQYDAMALTMTLTVGAYPNDYYQAVRESWRVAAAASRLINVNSGAPL